MQRIELVPGLASSRLGYGCARMGSAIRGQQADRLLREALDLGINHYDVAPSYGFGQAEVVLGRFCAGIRNRVIIATKFGIEPTLLGTLYGGSYSLLKPLLKLARPQATTRRDQPVLPFSPSLLFRRSLQSRKALRCSLEASLKRLCSDYVDLLLLHEPPGPLSNLGEVVEELHLLKKSGKIRAHGIAWNSLAENSDDLVRAPVDVLQMGPPNLDWLQPRRMELTKGGLVLFSAFRTADKAPSGPPTDLMAVLRSFPSAVFLTGTTDLKHLHQNISWICNGPT